MKFAEFLSENLVPEWRDKYLDYSEGKERIKLITKAQSPILSRSETPASPIPSLVHPHPTHRLDELLRLRQPTPSVASFDELPPAAITPDSSAEASEASLHHRPVLHERTPLLEGTRHPRVALLRSNSRSLPDIKKAASASSSPVDAGSYSATLPPADRADDAAIQDFERWLDGQYEMVESFYREKEDRCVTRFLLLQDQLFHLNEDKLKNKSISKEEKKRAKMDKAQADWRAYELPSLPRGLFKRFSMSDNSGRRGNRGDYEHIRREVPYYVAKRQLKTAVQEFYRKLEFLKSYREMNRTGFRKLLKKFDKRTKSSLSDSYMKKVGSSYFTTSEIIDNLLPKVEDTYSTNFEDGNRKVAVEKLRRHPSEERYYKAMFISGILFGFSLPLFAQAAYFGLHKTFTGELPEGKHLLQIWAGYFLLLLMTMFLGINCYIWTKYKVNYRFIFEFDPKTCLDYRQYPLLPSIFFMLLSIFGWFSFLDFWPDVIPARFWPWFFFVFAIVILFLPLNVLYYESRRWLVITAWRLCFSGFYPVEFKDFFLGDILCSLTFTMGNLPFFFCMYATHWSGSLTGGEPVCGSSRSRLMGFFSTLPPLWRCLQCMRRYADSGDLFPHLVNMVKYGITVLYFTMLSVYRIDSSISNRAIFIFVASINSVFSALWDIFMDWSLMQNKSLLRDDLLYPSWCYYFAIVSDVVLRFQWIFFALFNEHLQQSAVTSFFVGVAEIFRRFVWLAIRMENEHVTNIHLYRVAREAPLPYDTLTRTDSVTRLHEEAVEDDDEEFEETVEDIETGRSSPSFRSRPPRRIQRRNTIVNGDIFRLVSRAITTAHTKDFQRRRKSNTHRHIDHHGNYSSDEE